MLPTAKEVHIYGEIEKKINDFEPKVKKFICYFYNERVSLGIEGSKPSGEKIAFCFSFGVFSLTFVPPPETPERKRL